uniref:Plectin/eS10 N-terminal domain-containing protein n=1 Tax=Pelusios castaneus TaxID=367368 RepID=A0A8C8S7J7_9SAUR
SLMPTSQTLAIYKLLFREGVMMAKKDVHIAKHLELADKNVPNLHVMKPMPSLKSHGYLKEKLAWRHFYWYLTNKGIQYLHDYLHLPPEIVPAILCCSHPKTSRPQPKGPKGEYPAHLTWGEADRDSVVMPGLRKGKQEGYTRWGKGRKNPSTSQCDSAVANLQGSYVPTPP